MAGDEDGRAVLRMLRLDGFTRGGRLACSIASPPRSRLSGGCRMSLLRLPLSDQDAAGRYDLHGSGRVLRLRARALPARTNAGAAPAGPRRPSTSTGLQRRSSIPSCARTSGRCSTSWTGRARATPGLKPTETVVATADGRVLASSDPRSIPPWSRLPAKFLSAHAARRQRSPCAENEGTRRRPARSRDLGARWSDRCTPRLISRRCLRNAGPCSGTLLATNAALTLAACRSPPGSR